MWNDVRDSTTQTRKEIGFDLVKERWRNATPLFTKNTLTICDHPVMERWEDTYMHELAKVATQNKGIVLEVGYGMGISARYIQQYTPEQHIIIEANKMVAEKAKKFASLSTVRTKVVEGFWEEITEQIATNSLSGILFDTYPLTETEIHKNHFPFFKEAYRMLKPGGILTYYSDEIDSYSHEHRHALKSAGFSNIHQSMCQVQPPASCDYWKSRQFLVPIVTK